VQIEVRDDQLHLSSSVGEWSRDQFSLDSDDDVNRLSRGQGIRVEPVTTGRGFHWQHDIAVILPGSLQFSVVNGTLQLINELEVESYVACVATSEMGSAAPEVLLAAQTIVARCWALALVEKKHEAAGFHVCNDDCCQRYQGSTFVNEYSIKAARETAGKILVYGNKVIDARYSKNCGGLVEDFQTVWEGDSVPYLIPLWDGPAHGETAHYMDFDRYYGYDDAFCAQKRFQDVDLEGMLGKVDVSGSYYRWEQEVPKTLIIQNLKKYFQETWTEIQDIKVLRRGASARIAGLELSGLDDSGQGITRILAGEYPIRQVFSASFLYSSAFEVMNQNELMVSDSVHIRGCGWGHGVGLCQMGALGMALEGNSVDSILAHYYPGTELRSLAG